MKQTILHIITSLNKGGAEMMLYKHVCSSLSPDIKHAVICLSGNSEIAARLGERGIQVLILQAQNPFLWPTKLVQAIKFSRQFKPAIIHAWMYHSHFISFFIKLYLLKPVKLIWNVRQTLYNIKQEKLLTRLIIRFNTKLTSYVDVMIFNSLISMKQHHAVGYTVACVRFIPNGFDCKVYQPSMAKRCYWRKLNEISEHTLVIAHVARYHKMKSHDIFLRYCATIRSHIKNVKFVMYGNGVDNSNEKLTGLIHEFNLAQHVMMFGEVENMEDNYPGFDFLVQTSSYGEGFPNVLGEAMAAGVICIATDVGDSADIVMSNQFVIPTEYSLLSVNQLLDLLKQRDKYQQWSASSRNKIISHYQLAFVNNNYLMLYSALSNGSEIPIPILEGS